MRVQTKLASALLVLPLCSCCLWLGGCDSNGSDEPSPTSTWGIVAALAEADTQEEAEAAITAILQKTRLGVPGPYEDFFLLTAEDLADLARRLVAYNNRTQAGVSIGEAYEEVTGSWPPVEPDQDAVVPELEEALELFVLLANDALIEPEDPYSALLIAIVAQSGRVIGSISQISPGRPLSPLQYFLFRAWLQEFDPSTELSGAPGNVCPEDRCGTMNVFCHRGRRTLCYPPQAVRFHIEYHLGDRCGACHDQGGGS